MDGPLHSANEKIKAWVAVQTKLPYNTFHIPSEILGEMRKRTNEIEAWQLQHKKARHELPWFPDWWKQFRKPTKSATERKTHSLDDKLSPVVTEVMYDPNWSEKAVRAITPQIHEEEDPFYYQYEQWNPPAENDIQMEGGGNITHGRTRAGHRIIGHITWRKRVLGKIEDADYRYFIDVGPYDQNGRLRNPLRQAQHDDMEKEVTDLYHHSDSAREFSMDRKEFFRRQPNEFRKMLGMTFSDNDTHATYLWVASTDGKQEIVTKSCLISWMRGRARKEVGRFLKLHQLTPPYDLFPRGARSDNYSRHCNPGLFLTMASEESDESEGDEYSTSRHRLRAKKPAPKLGWKPSKARGQEQVMDMLITLSDRLEALEMAA